MRIRFSEPPGLPALSKSYRDRWPPFYSFMHLNAGLIYENRPSFKPVVKAKLPLNPQNVPPVHMKGMKVKNPSRTHWHTLFITSVVPHISCRIIKEGVMSCRLTWKANPCKKKFTWVIELKQKHYQNKRCQSASCSKFLTLGLMMKLYFASLLHPEVL